MSPISDVLEPNNLRLLFSAYNFAQDVVDDLGKDLSFVRTLIRALSPRARARQPPPPRAPLFPMSRPISVPELASKRIAILASGGSGATASLCGVRRAFEDAGLEPHAISACSGSVLFASLWACGLSAEDMARFWLTMRMRDYVDPSFGALARAPLRAFRSYTGLLRGEALEHTYEKLLGPRTLGETRIPFSAVVWNIDRNRVEHLSTRLTPDLSVARVVRVAISIPIMVQAVRIGEHYYGDGGIVDIFPAAPLLDERFDHIIGLNCYLPPNFAGEDIGNWYDRSFSILRACGQLRYASYLELAREHVRTLGPRLLLLHPVSYDEVHGAKFYESFLDRSEWPRYMNQGYDAARRALEALAQAARSPAATTAPVVIATHG